jgi:predicted RNA binding protein YcfA (HicA-like mRNA interferase family)
MPKKIRELKKLLTQAGFEQIPKRGKGSHTMWTHPLYNGRITLSGKDGKDAERYQEKDVNRAIKEVRDNES